ncbi:ATP-binding protein [Mesobacillus maritimus]|uniref:ATP-binding protein n=1 Tax=Mesobacillus maritimus TaxID=1643336 RepID=UPI00203C19B5|nr:ATP-binding protein [Mesobacillus maritimus]MCM3584414.1 ATP-binding protein [Mesobacillus maritimus]
MRDVLILPFNQDEEIVLACDNSGAIGMKEEDAVKAPYEVVGYYSFRVAVMECISAGAQPFAVTLQNFAGEKAWKELVSGIEKGKKELRLEDLKITGSTESNFTLFQSAIGVTVIGKKKKIRSLSRFETYSSDLEIAVIGSPLVGEEVFKQADEVAPLHLFHQICKLEAGITIPVGSKGVLFELNQLFFHSSFKETELKTNLDLRKSSGPSTCFIVVYPQGEQEIIRGMSGHFFHPIGVKGEANG